MIPKSLVATLLLVISFSASAQRMTQRDWRGFRKEDYTEAPRFWQRFYFACNKPFDKATMTYSYEGTNFFGKKETEHVVEQMPASGYGLGLGTFIPLAKLGKNSRLCLSGEITLTIYEWVKEEVGTSTVTYYGVFKQEKSIKETYAGRDDFSFPFTVDFRSGCDVMLSKEIPMCFAFGFGMNPKRQKAYYYSISGDTRYSLNPIIKAEVGFRAGMCFKVRAMYEMGKNRYINLQRGGGVYDESLILEGKQGFTLSLLIVPAAFSWGKDI